MLRIVLLLLLSVQVLHAQNMTLQALVTPSTTVYRDQRPVTFALYGLVEFKTLQDALNYVDAQTGRWQFPDTEARQQYGDGLLRRAVESRIVSMTDEEPLEVILTHTADELSAAINQLPSRLFEGRNWQLTRETYGDAFQRVRARWTKGINCWSASPLIEGRVLSNWYVIEEGIEVYGTRYDSLEHFWQAAKYHPSLTVADVLALMDTLDAANLDSWLYQVDHDQAVYLKNSYIIEFLRANLAPQKRAWFRGQLEVQPREAHVRELQERTPGRLRFTSFQEKVLWGDLADLFHLLVFMNGMVPLGNSPLLESLRTLHFDGVYLGNRKLGFISPEFRSLMLDLWRIKYLQIKRFNELIRNIPREKKIEHFLNDGDSPDIPIPIYIAYLNQIREIAWSTAAGRSISTQFHAAPEQHSTAASVR